MCAFEIEGLHKYTQNPAIHEWLRVKHLIEFLSEQNNNNKILKEKMFYKGCYIWYDIKTVQGKLFNEEFQSYFLS